MVDVSVRKEDGVKAGGRNWRATIARPSLLPPALKHPAIEKILFSFHSQLVHGASDRLRGTPECEFQVVLSVRDVFASVCRKVSALHYGFASRAMSTVDEHEADSKSRPRNAAGTSLLHQRPLKRSLRLRTLRNVGSSFRCLIAHMIKATR
jgi:hypothetical protein